TSVFQDETKREEETGYYVYSEDVEPYYHMHRKENTWLKGIGDISVILITAYYLEGDSVEELVIELSDYIEVAILHSVVFDSDPKLSIYFEPIIPEFSKDIDEMRKQNK